jgi:multiple sugar transport system ATP-binding protein
MSGVSIRNVSKRFGAVEVIRELSVEVSKGEFLVFVGPSGCGKSTLLRMIAGLESFQSGEIAIEGRVVNALHPSERNIAMVFQDYALYPQMTVRGNMGFGLKMRGTPADEVARRVDEAAAILQIQALLDRRPRELSGGQRQRVAMGRAIVRNPSVFLFDEPLSNLDAKLRVDMRAEIKALHQRLGTTAIYVTHDQVEAMTMADRIVVLNAGRIEQVGAPLALYHDPQTLFVAGFLGAPAMNFLPVTIEGAQVRLPGGGLLARPGATASGAALLGVRPERIRVVGPDAPMHVAGTVRVIEPLGADTRAVRRAPAGRAPAGRRGAAHRRRGAARVRARQRAAVRRRERTPAVTRRIVCLGAAVVDRVYEVDAIPATPQKVQAHGYREGCGGIAATAAVAIAHLGHPAELWARVGEDANGAMIVETLARHGVSTAQVRRSAGGRTPSAAVVVDAQGERLLAVFPGSGLRSDPDWLPIESLARADALLVDTRWPEGAMLALDAAARLGVASVLDGDLGEPELLSALTARVAHAIFSAPGLKRLTGRDDPGEGLRAAQALTRGTVAVTLGAEGAVWLEQGRLQRLPAYRVAARDTTGAGDTFHGAYALAIARGRPVAEAMRFASAAAAIKVQRGHGWDGMPDAAAVAHLIEGTT